MCLLFAATYPERTRGLVLYNPVAKGTAAPEYPWAQPLDQGLGPSLDELIASWGTAEEVSEWARVMAPSLADDAEFIRTIARNRRLGASPGAALTIRRMAADVDVRDVLPVIRVPTLVLNMPSARGEAEYVTARIPGAQRIEVPGPDYMVSLLGDRVYDEVEQFVRSLHEGHEPDTVLATVLFTDIVGSTAKAAALGDRPGPTSSDGIIRWCAPTSTAFADARWTRPGMAFSPRSTGRSARSAARRRSGDRS